jgi:rhodanese-related sulfurtransferase
MDGEISPAELEHLLEEGESPTVVDIRSPLDFEREHIPGSRNIPFGSLTQEIEAFEEEDHVVTVCPHGKASVQAANLITAYDGFDGRVESLESGLTGWEGPLETTESEREPDTDAPF